MTVGDAAVVREALLLFAEDAVKRHPDGPTYSRRERALAALDRLVAEVERLGTVEADRDDWIKRLNATERQCDAAEAERAAARAEAGKLRAALEFYANQPNEHGTYSDVLEDGGDRARAALAGSDAPPTPDAVVWSEPRQAYPGGPVYRDGAATGTGFDAPPTLAEPDQAEAQGEAAASRSGQGSLDGNAQGSGSASAAAVPAERQP